MALRGHATTDTNIQRRASTVGVTFASNSPKISGGNRVLMDVMMGLDRSQFRPAVTVPGDGPLAAWAASVGIPYTIVPVLGWSGRVDLARASAALLSAIVRHGSRIVHASSPMVYRAAGVAAWFAGAARVCHLGYPPEEGELERSFKVEPHVIIACHEGQARDVGHDVRSLTRSARLIAVPNGVDVSRFRPRDVGDEIPDWHLGKPVVAILGHLSEVKGYPAFLQAAAQIVAAGEDCAFVAIGNELAERGYRAVLDRMVAELGLSDRVTFLGFRPDVAPVLRSVDVMVMPSLAEGLPIALLEAMASACPIVASSVGGIPEAIDDGVNGLLVQPGDVDGIAGSVLSLLRNRALASTLGRQARIDAVSRFSVSRAVETIQATYADLLYPAYAAPRFV